MFLHGMLVGKSFTFSDFVCPVSSLLLSDLFPLCLLPLSSLQSLTKLKHPNIIKVKEVFRENNKLYIVFEYMKQNLYEMITSR